MLTLRDILVALGFSVPGRTLAGDRHIVQVTQDSREVRPASMFVARRGETTDGHIFINDAVAAGAAVIMAERVVDLPTPAWILDTRQGTLAEPADAMALAYVLVPDSQKALEQVAVWWRRQMAVDVIGITGSVGKTSSKELIAAVLSQRFSLLKSERSLNTDVGMALTLLQLTPQHEKAVLEMGMYSRGEIAHLCELAQPRVGVVTNVGPTHLERLGTIEAIADAKAELVEALPVEGVAVLNGDDQRVRAMTRRTKASVFTYGLTSACDLWADGVESRGLGGIRCCLHYKTDTLHVQSPLLGTHNVQTVLAAAAVGLTLGLTWDEIAAGLKQVPPQLRLIIVPAVNDARIIDDTYNASPASCLAALNLLAEMKGRRIAVLGDMLELGSFEDEGHRQVGRRAREVADVLVVVGQRGRIIGEEARRAGMHQDTVFFAGDNDQAISTLRLLMQPGDFILIKGSRGMRMEEIVHRLMAGSAG